jgi:hypothetical protein
MKPSDYIKKGWCQGANAKDFNGWECGPLDDEAVSWCALGSLWAAYNSGEDVQIVQEKICAETGWETVAAWNDSSLREKQDILDVFEKLGI